MKVAERGRDGKLFRLNKESICRLTGKIRQPNRESRNGHCGLDRYVPEVFKAT